MIMVMVLLLGVMAAPSSIAAAQTDEVIFDNENIATVFNEPTFPTQFTISESHVITFLRTYHWNNMQGEPAVTIALRHSDGTMYGPWQARGITGYLDVLNAYWLVEPNVTIKAGSYTIVDSNPYTWSYNSQSGGSGFALVKGYKIASATVTAASYDLTGKWSINANRSSGTFEISSQTGNEFSGTVNIDSGKSERLIDGRISGNTISFTRMWDSGNLYQSYTGTLSVDANGNATISGTFSQNNSSSTWTWTASKATPILSPSTTTPGTPATSTTSTTSTSAGSTAEAFDSGARMEWTAVAGLGYRVFRSTDRNQLGISITDFYITSTRVVDVNVEPNTEYHYTVKPVLAEARPLQGVEEQLGAAIATFTIRTGSNISDVGRQKGFIILQMDNPMMIVNGISQEIDPGRGTTPIIISGRSMVPIRAIVEAMGGSIGWDGSDSRITLNARDNQVEMWLNKNDIRRNAINARMDVVPVSQRGRTFVPVRFASENLDAKADWINSTREVVIVFTE